MLCHKHLSVLQGGEAGISAWRRVIGSLRSWRLPVFPELQQSDPAHCLISAARPGRNGLAMIPTHPHPSSWLGLAVNSNTALPRARFSSLYASARPSQLSSLHASSFPLPSGCLHTHTPCTPHTLTARTHTHTTYTSPAFL